MASTIFLLATVIAFVALSLAYGQPVPGLELEELEDTSASDV